jgi:hypothetical protein
MNDDSDTPPARPKALKITPINRLKNKVGGNMTSDVAGQFDQRLVAQATVAVEKLRPPYKDQTGADLKALTELVTAAQTVGAAQRGEFMSRIASIALNIQGLGNTFGYELMTQFGRSLRRFAWTLDSATDEQLLIVKAHIDTMRVVMARDIRGDGGVLGKELWNALEKAMARYGT